MKVYIFLLLVIIIGCSSPEYKKTKSGKSFESELGTIPQESVERIEIYKDVKFGRLENKVAPCIIYYPNTSLIIDEINNAKFAGPVKSGQWNEIHIIYKDTTIILNFSEKFVGPHRSSGWFYKWEKISIINFFCD